MAVFPHPYKLGRGTSLARSASLSPIINDASTVHEEGIGQVHF